jgi:hypothetical protein
MPPPRMLRNGPPVPSLLDMPGAGAPLSFPLHGPGCGKAPFGVRAHQPSRHAWLPSAVLCGLSAPVWVPVFAEVGGPAPAARPPNNTVAGLG